MISRNTECVQIVSIVGVITLILIQTEHLTSADKNGSAPISSNRSDHRAADTSLEYKFPTPILLDDVRNISDYFYLYENRSYNWGVLGFGASDFLSYAAHFCKYDAEDGAIEIVSVGSGDGTIEKDICDMHEKLFGTKLNITLVDNDPKFVNVQYRTVKDLIKDRRDIVGNCALLLIWPEDAKKKNDYDIEAVRKLQPRALLTLYESYNGLSGSLDFRKWMLSRAHKNYSYLYEDTKRPKLKKYRIVDDVKQGVNFNPRLYSLEENTTYEVGPGKPIFKLRITRLKRKGFRSVKARGGKNVTSSNG